MARWTIYIRQGARGWEWAHDPSGGGWWGFYRTEGLAKGAAKRSTTPVIGSKTNPDDFEFVRVGGA